MKCGSGGYRQKNVTGAPKKGEKEVIKKRRKIANRKNPYVQR